MNLISFTSNWNNGKLSLYSFSTIRLRDDYKYKLGLEFVPVLLNSKKEIKEQFEPAKIVFIRHFLLSGLSEIEARMDTGYGRYQTIEILRRMYGNKGIDFEKKHFSFIIFSRK
jgi:hypothetical protein